MPVRNQCKQFSNCLTIDFCEHCGAKDWQPESLHDRTMRERGERYSAKKNAEGLREELRELGSCLGVILGFVLIAGLALGGLWLLVTLIKFMWEHS